LFVVCCFASAGVDFLLPFFYFFFDITSFPSFIIFLSVFSFLCTKERGEKERSAREKKRRRMIIPLAVGTIFGVFEQKKKKCCC